MWTVIEGGGVRALRSVVHVSSLRSVLPMAIVNLSEKGITTSSEPYSPRKKPAWVGEEGTEHDEDDIDIGAVWG